MGKKYAPGKHPNSLKNLGKGRKKGATNKLPTDLKEKILAICAQLEAENKGLADCALQQPKWFYEHFLKPLLPKSIEAKHDFVGQLAQAASMALKQFQQDKDGQGA